MERTAYQTRAWRNLPRTDCILEQLVGDAAGPCHGAIHRHHVDPRDPNSRTVEVCAAHHPKVHALIRTLVVTEWKSCNHNHRYEHARRECERKLNRLQ